MQINQIRFKNFNSYGDELIEINFNKKNSLNILLGLNGTGKCLSKDTELEIDIEDPEIREQFINFLKNKNKNE